MKPAWLGSVACAPLLLDGRSDIAAAFSLRRVRSAFTGALLRVRRSSDNAEQDFAASAPALNWSDLLAFIGAGSGFVSRWYDQGGNGRDLLQATAANQPAIALLGSRPGLTFNGSTHYLQTSAFTLNQPWSFNLCYRRVSTVQATSESITDGVSAANTGSLFNRVGDNPNGTNTLNAGTIAVENTTSMPAATRGVVGACFNGASSLMEVDAAALESLAGHPGTGNPGGLTLGTRADAPAARFADIEVQEWIAFNAAHTSAQLQADNAALRRAWGF
jgi:hypothetical protein